MRSKSNGRKNPGTGYLYQEKESEPHTGSQSTQPGTQEAHRLSEDEMQAITDHVEEHIGEVTWVMHELDSGRLHIDILVVEPTPERDYYTLLTMGMSALPMSVPEEAGVPPYTELMICLPSDWIMGEVSGSAAEHDIGNVPPMLSREISGLNIHSGNDANYWPIRWLKILARLPADYDTWLGYGHSVPAGEPFAENTRLNGILLSPPLENEDFFTLTLESGKEILFWNLVPIYEEEMQLKLEAGADELFELFDRHHVSPIVDPQRKNVAVSVPDVNDEDEYERTRPN